jgi:hypothetical protein
MIGGAILGSSILGGIGSSKAAKAQERGAKLSAQSEALSTERNIQFQKWLWGEQKELSEPYREAGTKALAGYEEAIAEPFDYKEDPGYQFRLSEGLKGVERSAAAKGMQLSGRTLKGLGRYAQDYASDEFGKAYARRQQGISNLYNLASMGQAAAAGQAQAGGAMGANISQSILRGGQAQSQMYSDIGNIQAASAMAPYNIASSAISQGAMMYGAGGFGGGGGSAIPAGGITETQYITGGY